MKTKSNTSKTGIARKLTSVMLSAAMVGSAFMVLSGTAMAAEAAPTEPTVDYGLADTSQEGVILHCWNWSYNNIKKYMKDIAAAGYTSIQTSPVTQPKDYYWEGVAYGNVGIPDGCGGEDGNWWKVYQPVTMSICDNGYTWFGTKEEFKAMCDEAEKYGVRVIVDIVANHMGNIQGWKIGDVEAVMSDISPQVGEFWNPDMLTDSSYWHISDSWVHSSDGRYDVTQGNMGMPDLNTGDSKVQQMVLNLLKECIDCGADGFRFDAAKHIETPADNPAFASDFWDVVLDGARDYYKQVNGYDGIYFYGETLNRLDDTAVEAYYRSKMSITDNSTSDNLRNSVINGGISGLANSAYCGYINGEGDKAVLWAESHDTYMGGGSSYDANDTDIKRTWAIVASRKDSTGLFFARPYYSKDILAGDVSKARQSTSDILSKIDQAQMGDVGTLTWADKSVVEVNRFRNFFIGQSESLGSSGNNIAYNVRGTSGIVIVKGDGAGTVTLNNIVMANGTYVDQVTGEKFTVYNRTLTGNVTGEDGIAVIYNPTTDYGDVNPEEPVTLKISAKTEDGSTSFTTDSIDVTLQTENAVSSTYTTTEGDSGSFTGSKTITIGTKTEPGNTIGVTINATSADGTKKSKTYKYTKKGARTDYPKLDAPGIVFDNEAYGWADVWVYIYDENINNNGTWPGAKMTEVAGDYWTYEIPSSFSDSETLYVIFSNGAGIQYPTTQGLEMLPTEKKLFINNAFTDLPASTSLRVNLSSSATTVTEGGTVTFTATPSDNDGDVQYQFSLADGTILKAYSSSATYTWTPTKADTYVVKVTAKDSSNEATATTTITVTAKATELINNSTISKTTINKGDSITINAVASGGVAPYQYAMSVKHSTATGWTTIKSYSTTATKTWTPAKTGTYKVCAKVKDSAGTEVKKFFTLTVNALPLTNNSTISTTTITKGESVTIKASATGGTAPYQYAMTVRHSTATGWTTIKSYSSTTTRNWTPAKTGTYSVCAKVKDASGKEVKKFFTLTVKASTSTLKNTSTISTTTINKGDAVTIKASATGGTTPYQYAITVKHSTANSWTTIKSYSTTTTRNWTPAKTGTYQVCAKVKDAKGVEVKKFFTLTVK